MKLADIVQKKIVKELKPLYKEPRRVRKDDEPLNIPGVDPDHPNYKEICNGLSRLKKANPHLYHKILNWD